MIQAVSHCNTGVFVPPLLHEHFRKGSRDDFWHLPKRCIFCVKINAYEHEHDKEVHSVLNVHFKVCLV